MTREYLSKIYMIIPKNWRQGQFYFNFLCWLSDKKDVAKNQSMRMADPFHLPDSEWNQYLEEFLETLK